MAIYAYTGVPGSGKSYALIEQQIIPAVAAGRRVLTNVDGAKPDAIRAYVLTKWPDTENVGEVVLFHGEDSVVDGFWPVDQAAAIGGTFVQPGDLVVYDEWRLYWPRRGKMPTDQLEKFLRYHRHLTNEKGVACDVAIGTQLASDVAQDFRGLIERSFKFQKLKAIGLPKAFTWYVYEGHLQPKGGHYAVGHGMYEKAIFGLYQTSSAAIGAHTEAKTDSRSGAFQKWWLYAGVAMVVLAGFALWYLGKFFSGEAFGATSAAEVAPSATGGAAVASAPAVPPSSPWRVTGHYVGEYGIRVILTNDAGAVRYADASQFTFEGDRPIAGVVDGLPVRVEDRLGASEGPSLAGGLLP